MLHWRDHLRAVGQRPRGGGVTMQQVTVRVPASTSNLGPGYDCLGVALRLYNSVTLVRGNTPDLPIHELCLTRQNDFSNRRGAAHSRFRFQSQNRVPRCRGLGSSATVRLGILLGLNRLSGDPLDRLTLFRLCAESEGHPDNAAPAAFGGFTVVQSSGEFLALRAASGTHAPPFSASRSRRAYISFSWFRTLEIETARARRILPSKISRVAAVENCANACAITAAFASRDYEKMRGTFSDNLHQPFRAKLIQFLPRVIAAAERAGALGAFLSGSGSAIAAVTLQAPEKIAAAMARAAAAARSHNYHTR